MSTQNDVSLGVRGRNVIFTLERHYKYMKTYMTQSNYLRDFFSAMAYSWKKLKTSYVFSSFIVCSNRNRSALVHEMLSNNSLSVGQL